MEQEFSRVLWKYQACLFLYIPLSGFVKDFCHQLCTKWYTVKPVLRGHRWDKEKVAL
jgi:hypothetical protein